MKKKEVSAEVFFVTVSEEKRAEKRWDQLCDKEKDRVSQNLTDKFMTAAGYVSTQQQEQP
ncbi:hypothetical protein [Sinanaerobacter chloroacetimidivorans]|jgi:cytidylate kinase|uniref:Uncharacterized protein n=1 Tax=Sinanaerobacter chloroacetimidivorans TaxID=2818044 RepID=A0A8J7W390_9FIRM|nr:hypothetical protein [Sinanaerobacter chloroacetimidivorans]MBR0598353.1 hypothetical protein [Sinanaerobacter chloroacetimidivorans]